MNFSPFCRSFEYLFIFGITGIISLMQCNQPVAGGTSTTDNPKVIGQVVNSDGSPAGSTVVTLYPADYDPVADAEAFTVPTDTTDSDGYYRMSAPDSTWAYSVVATDPATGTRALVTDIVLTGDTTWTVEAKLVPPGAVSVAVPDSAAGVGGYVYIPGTGIVEHVNIGGMVLLERVPAGVILSVNYVAATAPKAATVLTSAVEVTSDDTVVIPFPEWRYFARVYLNTTPSGADIAGDVTGFPVLLRLTEVNFDFAQAAPGGSDVRFSDIAGKPLPYEIERWDADIRQAEVWVKVDTIRGNDSVQSIVMHWGNPVAPDNSDGTAVFDTADGFQGVWHLGDSTRTVLDATVNKYNGEKSGNQTRIAGNVGNGQYFDGSGDFIDMGNVCNLDTSGLTVYAWIKLAVTNKILTIISKSNGGPSSSSYGWLITLDANGALQAFIATDTGSWGASQTFVVTSSVFIEDTVEWHHVAVVITRSESNDCRLYIDGIDVTTLPTAGDIIEIGSVVNSTPLRLGSSGGTPWNGILDECTLSFRACSHDWIRLCYMNQRADDRFITVLHNINVSYLEKKDKN